MMDESDDTDIQPTPWHFGVEVLRFEGLTTYLWSDWRFTWYKPRDRQNWQFNFRFDREMWEIGVGPAVLTWVEDDYYWRDLWVRIIPIRLGPWLLRITLQSGKKQYAEIDHGPDTRKAREQQL